MATRACPPTSSAVLDLGQAIAAELGEDRILRSEPERRLLERDMGDPPAALGRLLDRRAAPLAFRPQSAEEVAVLLRRARASGVGLTPRGLGSAGLGGAVPLGQSAVLDLSAMRGVQHLDPARARCRAACGTSFFAIGREARRHGLRLAAQPTNAFGTIGGWASVGGLGLGSLHAGGFCHQVEAIDVVLPDGRPEHLTQRDRGFADFFDTEGQLGILTALELRLEPARVPIIARGFVLPDAPSAADFVRALCGGPRPPRAVLWLGRGREHPELGCAPEAEILLVEDRADAPPAEPLVADAPALPAALAARLHARRFFPLDVAAGPLFLASEALVPLERAAELIDEARASAARHGTVLYEHAHAVRLGSSPALLILLAFPCDPARPVQHMALAPLAALLTRRAVALGGTPYGIGIWNTPLARHRFPNGRYEALAARKRALDPNRLLNPGKLFGLGPEAGWIGRLLTGPQYGASLRIAELAAPSLRMAVTARRREGTTAERCIWCGACVPVCPAVEVTGAESVSARAKLDLLRRLAGDEQGTREELLGSQRCLYCGQCEEVCARGLELVAAWRELETLVRQRVGEAAVIEQATRFASQVDGAAERVVDLALDPVAGSGTPR